MRVVLGLLLLIFLYLFYSHAKYSSTGIDLTDEAFHYFLLQSSKPGFPGMVYGNLFGPIINILDLEIAEIRMLSLITHLLCGLLLAFAIKLKLSKSSNKWPLIYTLFITFTPFILYGIQGRFLSYNSLTFCIISLIISCLIFASLCRNQFKSNTLVFISAILTGIQFGVKFPTFIILFLLVFLTILFCFRLANLLFFLFGNFLGIITVHKDVNIIEIINYYRSSIGEYGFAGFHGSKSFLDLYLNSVYIQFFQILTKLDIIVVIFTMLYIKRTSILNSIIVTFLFCYLLFRSWHCSYFQSGESAYFCATPWFLSAVSVIALAFYYHFKRIIIFKRNEVFFLIILFCSPFLCSLGTNTSLIKQFPVYLTFTSVLIVILLCKMPKTKGSFLLPVYLLIITFSVNFNSIFQNPVRTDPLNQISNKPRNTHAGDIRLDDSDDLIISSILSFIDLNTKSGSSLPYIDLAGNPGTYLFLDITGDFPYFGQWLDNTSTNRLERIFSDLKKSSKTKIFIHCRQDWNLDKFGSFESSKIIMGTNLMVGLFVLNS
jgi:hypothetical protein